MKNMNKLPGTIQDGVLFIGGTKIEINIIILKRVISIRSLGKFDHIDGFDGDMVFFANSSKVFSLNPGLRCFSNAFMMRMLAATRITIVISDKMMIQKFS
jgi:hypothetical protein